MPIRKELRWLYPIDWPQVSAWVRFERAKGRCERCGRPHGQVVQHLGDGRWFDAGGEVWRNGRGRQVAGPAYAEYRKLASTKVVLAAAHLDHDPSNTRPRNLRALCQRCHMLYDQAEHQRRRRITYRARQALGDLFQGTYRRW